MARTTAELMKKDEDSQAEAESIAAVFNAANAAPTAKEIVKYCTTSARVCSGSQWTHHFTSDRPCFVATLPAEDVVTCALDAAPPAQLNQFWSPLSKPAPVDPNSGTPATTSSFSSTFAQATQPLVPTRTPTPSLTPLPDSPLPLPTSPTAPPTPAKRGKKGKAAAEAKSVEPLKKTSHKRKAPEKEETVDDGSPEEEEEELKEVPGPCQHKGYVYVRENALKKQWL
ncbi:hypothetical protein C8F01DRAFT_1267376 [Mycena amicta]|nr:hypothetical protein C8F01DRAFT_1267376 [Mycena amicta]